ncbi:hypothetical protein LTR56_016769 [Elasticomyces elasticus]|nr:hypothetical protein LTR56_016769 [Elasticomyces elasticus]KAK3644896.1 hypothetical protein LTR22_015042 [Elasticomyces elasticus]KAK4923365.1 hypothetical protein LTR49_009435 [Elasticomyces elasticus]KAK5753270.1 hypothetical protein LTS12_016606 [Elasticomyces elasticus]
MWAKFKDSDLVRELTLPLILISVYASLGGASFGLDFNSWSGQIGMAQFKKDLGVFDEGTESYIVPSTWLSIGSGTPQAGLAMGCLVAGFVGRAIGRVRCFYLAASIGIVGILVQASTIHSYWQFMVGRVINSVSMGIICNVVPAYQSECAPAKIRGTLINTYQFWLLVGAVMAATCNWGTQYWTTHWAWRLVVVIQFLIPILMLVGGTVLPESPRWLVGKGRNEQALKVLRILRRGAPDDVIQQEWRLLIAAEEEQAEHHSATTWLDCFRGSNLRRTAIATGVQCLQNAQGNSFIATYSIVFLQAIGVTDTYKVLILLYFTNMVASGFAFYFADKIGRRPLLFGAACVMAICMFTVAGVTGYDNNSQSIKGALACLFIWQFVQAVGWSSCVWIVTAETPTLQLREKTITISTFAGFIVGVLVTYINPYMQDAGFGNLQGKVGFVYGSFSVVAAVWVVFMLPELKGRALEELDEMFEKNVSVFQFSTFQTEGWGAQIARAEQVAAAKGHAREASIIDGVEPDIDIEVGTTNEKSKARTKIAEV